jgi:hypothetical protein
MGDRRADLRHLRRKVLCVTMWTCFLIAGVSFQILLMSFIIGPGEQPPSNNNSTYRAPQDDPANDPGERPDKPFLVALLGRNPLAKATLVFIGGLVALRVGFWCRSRLQR